ncbi:MAG: NAD(P)/FAD-dependent oxidoreductase [Syntrophaceae bacterium]|nr:NAD(P)/FAD-dependent oxidoreductase [Syntrophaceae bacterium]
MRDCFSATVIGAGVVGLAVAERLSREYRDVLLLERHESCGRETSSRNSEVIHAGIYYPAGFVKAALCREGNRLLYEACTEWRVPHRRVGKMIVAGGDEDGEELHRLRDQAERNGVMNLRFLTPREIRRLEPAVRAREALFSPSTGIVDSHRFMQALLSRLQTTGATAAFRSDVTAVRPDGDGFDVEINGGEYRFRTKVLVNSAGLASDRLAAMAGIDVDAADYRLKYCKGSYFSASAAPRLKHLVYPAPDRGKEGLGIHATVDLAGRVRFGPDVQYVERIDYDVDEGLRSRFHEAIRRYLPGLPAEVLQPDMCGIRPKLQGPGEPYRDFIIREESDRGFPGLVNLVGIESPGLTASLAIGHRVASLAEPFLEGFQNTRKRGLV